MITIQEKVNLRPYNSFGIDSIAAYFVQVRSVPELLELRNHPVFQHNPHLILGGGSNILLTRDPEGLVVYTAMKGIDQVREDEAHVWVKAAAGENWHGLVMYCVERNFGGIENLSLIPGSVGAAPMQNIGAYGVEIKDVVEKVEGIELTSGKLMSFTNAECQFDYRESVFKRELKGKIFVSSVTLRLTKKNHRLKTDYGSLREVLAHRKIEQPTLRQISDAVIHIRSSKLPDPAVLGNAGSFFKNPALEQKQYELLKKEHPEIPGYPAVNQHVKVPAAWLIEQCGWKGKTINSVGVHKQHALVLVNYGGGQGAEIFQLAMQIQASVKSKFGITLTPEVNII